MKKYFKIHPLTLLTTSIILLCGYFKHYIIMMLIIFIHEIGHIIAGYIFKFKIIKTVILPFGCITYFKTELNTKTYKEFIVTISGPIFQIIGSIILYIITKNDLVLFFNKIILILNLIPIIPLDGSKIVESILFKITSYYNALKINEIISIITIFIILIYNTFKFNFLILIWIILLIIENIKNNRLIKYKFYIFLKERYNNYYSLPYLYISGINIKKIKKDYKTIFRNNNNYVMERDIIKTYLFK